MAIAFGCAFAPVPFVRAFSLSSLLGNHEDRNDNIKKINVADLAALMRDKNSHVFVYDANVTDVRAKHGIIPGAVLLSSPDDYDVAQTLPADKNAELVFYCTNRH
ncbi:MAG: hypothetical protein IVW54_11660 [Candidatus Binataceae bacterium]|nr:hypothetical protein [Candidatus Binataceae bacterium]